MTTTAAPTDVRAWLRAKHPELDIADKGRIRGDLQAEYDAEHQADPPGTGGDAGDYDEGVAAGDFTDAADPPGDGPEKPRTETKPRRVSTTRTPRQGRVTSWLTGKGKGKEKTGRTRKAFKRVPVDRLIGRVWTQLADAAPILPLEKMLYAQAPFAGMVLEDVVRGTIVDTVLQPIARAEEKANAVTGLLGPPMFTMMALATAPEPGQRPTMQHRAALGGLRITLMAMTDAVGDRLEEVMDQAAASKRKSVQVDRFIEWLFEMPEQATAEANGDGSSPAPSDMEEEAVERARQMFAGDDTG